MRPLPGWWRLVLSWVSAELWRHKRCSATYRGATCSLDASTPHQWHQAGDVWFIDQERDDHQKGSSR